MSSHATRKRLRAIVEAEGAEIVSIEQGKHFKVTCRRGGCTVCITASITPSDVRNDRNSRAQLRRALRDASA